MGYTPLNYDQINIAAGSYSPSPIKAYNNKSFKYWERALFQRAMSVIKLDVDNEWTGEIKDFLYYCLFRFGYVGIFNDDRFGFSFQPGTLYGFDFYYQPTEFIISNPALNTRLKIHEECELLKLTPDYQGIWDIITYYAARLSSLDVAIDMSIVNNKVPFIMGARNKAASEALKKIMDKVNKGEPLVVFDQQLLNDKTDKDVPFQMFDREHLKNSYITSDQLMDMQTILNSFDNEIGIPTVPYQKKERMVTAEADSRVIDSQARATIWMNTLNSSIEAVNKKFGKTFKAELNFKMKEEASDVNNEDNSNRA